MSEKVEYNPIIGAIVNKGNDEKLTQAELLFWTATHPEPVKIDEPKLTKAKAPAKIVEEGVESITIKERI